MDEEEVEEIYEIVDKLHGLLEEPEPDIPSWGKKVRNSVDDIIKWRGAKSDLLDSSFKLGKEVRSLIRRIQEKEEVLIHQSCDEILDILKDIDGDVDDIILKLNQIEDIIEWAEGNVEMALFWLFIKSKGSEVEGVLEKEIYGG